MEADTTNCHGLRCFICGGPGTEMQKLSKVTHKGYQQLLSYSEIVDDAMLINRLHEDWKDGDDTKLKYHLDCRTELCHRSRSVSNANRSGFFHSVNVVATFCQSFLSIHHFNPIHFVA
jgi:hypothetical protein